MTEAKAPTKRGRPPAMSAEQRDDVLDLIASGMPNLEACTRLEIEPRTLYNTIARDQDFFQRYDQAKKAAVDALVDRARAEAQAAKRAENGAQVQGHKLAWDHEWREAQRLAPHRWGEKAQVELSGNVSTNDPLDIAKRLAFIEALGQASIAGDVVDATDELDDQV